MPKIPYKFRLLLSSCFLNIIFRLKIGLYRKSYYESMTYPLYLQIFHKLIHSNCGKRTTRYSTSPKVLTMIKASSQILQRFARLFEKRLSDFLCEAATNELPG